ncbi:hypothetical protein AWQ21_02265 [Picosynechococcus sp. PCC 7003]|nr:hypothetical protein AWQ21_02265 [Picosynechococcus sp. PCC 7003]
MEKIEELFSELDAGVESLKAAQAKLKLYRQALLKQAFEGKLTEQWRKENADKLEPAEQLLERIKQEREARYQKQLDDWKTAVKEWESQGKPGKKPTKPQKTKFSNLEKLESPITLSYDKNWQWVQLKNICYEITDGDHQAPPKSDFGIPFITISNIDKNNNTIDFSETFFVPETYFLSLPKKKKPIVNDILYTVTGSFGIPVLITHEKDFCFQRHIGLIRPSKHIFSKWLYYLLSSDLIYSQAKEKSTGTAQKTVSLSSLREFEIPLCSYHEQLEISDLLDYQFSEIEKMEAEIKISLQKSEIVRQSILKKAFSGQLIPQDPNDEPASVLLERIREEKAATKNKK